jgi:arginine exporter protein ArgO
MDPLAGDSTMTAFALGVVAGLGIAIPVGAIAVLILETGRRWGFRIAASAGLGAALADLTYATIATIVGAGIAHLLAAHTAIIHWASGALLAVLALRALIVSMGGSSSTEERTLPPRRSRVTVTFLGLTLANPLTITYFAALVAGSGHRVGGLSLVPFVLGVFLASLAWQTLLAGAGTVLGRQLPQSSRRLTGVLGSVVIGALAVKVAFGA